MAITLTSQMTDKLINPGSPTSVGTGNAQASETVINLEGTNCAAIGHSGSVGPTAPSAINEFRGMYATITSTTRTDNHVHLWVRDLYPIRNANVGGVSVYLFGSSEAIYYATGLDKGYLGSWYHAVINWDTFDRPAASLGTAPSANITRVGYCGNISASKGEDFLQNCYFDAVRTATGGQGITMYGGTSGTHETFDGCVSADTANYGLFRDIGGAYFIEGPLTFGVATQNTYITEVLKTLNFTNFTVNNGTGGNTIVPSIASNYYSITLKDGTTGVTSINWTDVTLKGASISSPFRFECLLGAGDNFTSLRTTFLYGNSVIFDTYCSSTNDTFIECVAIDLGPITLTEPTFSNCEYCDIAATGAAITGGSTTLHNTATNVMWMFSDDLDRVTNHSFDNTGGTGWAILVNTITATRSDDCDGNTFTGYSTTVNGNKAVKVNVASGQTYTINVINGSNLTAAMVYNSGPGTVIVNAGTVAVTVTCIEQDGTPIENALVHLRASDGTGPFPYQESVTITRATTVATVAHTAHGMAVGDKVLIGGAVQEDYNDVFTITTVPTANSYTYTVAGSPTSPATGTIVSTFVALQGLTNASGIITTSRVYATDQPVGGWGRKSSSAPYFQQGQVIGTIDNLLGFSGISLMLSDE